MLVITLYKITYLDVNLRFWWQDLCQTITSPLPLGDLATKISTLSTNTFGLQHPSSTSLNPFIIDPTLQKNCLNSSAHQRDMTLLNLIGLTYCDSLLLVTELNYKNYLSNSGRLYWKIQHVITFNSIFVTNIDVAKVIFE